MQGHLPMTIGPRFRYMAALVYIAIGAGLAMLYRL